MDCPKCKSKMREHTVVTLQGEVTIDRCTSCNGLWFDNGEAEILKDDWMSEFLDSGDPDVGDTFDSVRNIECPRCSEIMATCQDPKQRHIQYEACPDHGIFMDAGEFTDYKHETLLDVFKDAISALK